MTEKEDIRGEAERALARLERADKASGLADYYAHSASHSYLRSVADGRFSLLKPKRLKKK